MQRKNFIQKLGVALAISPFFYGFINKSDDLPAQQTKTACGDAITPHVADGPFYVNEKMNRSVIHDGKPGIPLTLIFKVEDVNCKLIPGAIIDIWHCDHAGVYSDENQQGTGGQKWLRGYQVADENGKCTFKTVFPGWYNGRLTHIHGKVKVGELTKQTTNFFIPKAIEQAVFATSHYAARGQNPITVQQDVELRGDTERYKTLMMDVTGDVSKGYVATYTVAFA